MARSLIDRREIAHAFADEALRRQYPPICGPHQLAHLLGYPVSTIYAWRSRGYFEGAYRKRGKRVRFWRDKAVELFFNGPDWN